MEAPLAPFGNASTRDRDTYKYIYIYPYTCVFMYTFVYILDISYVYIYMYIHIYVRVQICMALGEEAGLQKEHGVPETGPSPQAVSEKLYSAGFW